MVKKKKVTPKTENIITDNRLYFRLDIPDVGTISCKSCGYNQKLVGSWHSGIPDETCGNGYQCQTCGNFHEIICKVKDLRNVEIIACDCGGKLERKMPLFCPQCKSFELSYKMSYIN